MIQSNVKAKYNSQGQLLDQPAVHAIGDAQLSLVITLSNERLYH